MINLIHEKTNYNAGIPAYGNLIVNNLNDYNIPFKDIAVPKIEININNHKIGGWLSKSILSKIMVNNENVNHSLDHWTISKFTNLLTIHDIIPFIYNDNFHISNIAYQYYLRIFKQINNINDIIVLSNHVKNTLNDIKYLDLSNKNIHIIPRGINSIKFIPINPYSNDNKIHLITIGEFSIRKRFDLLYDYVKDLKDVKLYHIGRIANMDSYKNAMKNINNNVVYLGYMKNSLELYSYIYYADKFVYNTLDEGQGLPALEAMRLGVQPIVNNIEIHKEMLGNYGFLYNNKEEFRDLIYKESNKSNVLINFVKKYDDWFEKMINIYEKLENN